MEIHGEVAPGFEGVRDAFAANFDRHGDVGAAFALYRHGTKVVDIWGGVADAKEGTPWDEGTMALVYSTTKGVTAVAAHLLSQRGDLDLEAPVVEYWPEFKAEGKEATTRWLLGHRAGLPALDGPMTPEAALAWDPVVEALAAQRPLWDPGTRHGYHALTYGWLVGEVVRRITGKSLGRFVADEISGPLGLDLWIGLPESEEPRVSRLIAAKPIKPTAEERETMHPLRLESLKAMADPNSLSTRALNVTKPPFNFNSRAVHAAELPAANAITTARSLARMYAATVSDVDGVRLLSPDTVADASREVSAGRDEVLIVPTRFGSGFFIPSAFEPMLGPTSFGHAGAGGSLGFADPDSGVAFGYVMNAMQQNMANDPRTGALKHAVRDAIG